MSRVIWKYDLGSTTTRDHDLPVGAKLVHAGLDPAGKLCVWMEVDNEYVDTETHTFGVFDTNLPIPDEWTYCDSVHVGTFVLHVYHHDIVVPVSVDVGKLDDLGDES
jgi:hypothetical protein